jgi:hypothetical protein
MRPEVSRAMTESAAALQDVIWPLVGPLVGGGRLVPVETVTSAGFTKELDLLAGVDAWQIIDDRGMRGLASRVQFDDRDWSTFTIRKRLPSGRETEWHKRLRWYNDRDRGWLGPHLTCQAYTRRATEGLEPISAAIVRTRDIVGAIQLGHSYERTNRADRNVMACIDWAELERIGAEIRIWRAEA